MPVVTTIKLTGDNHQDVDLVCQQIKAISDETGVNLRGPIPLPTRRLVVPCRKSPDGEGSETWDHWGVSRPDCLWYIHKLYLTHEGFVVSDEHRLAVRVSCDVSSADIVSG